MLEWLNYVFDVDRSVIKECHKKSKETKYYFSEKLKEDSKFVSRWHLGVPESILAGGEEKYW